MNLTPFFRDDVSLLAVGTCSIEATQAGDATYLPATPVVRSFEVLEADVGVSPGSLSSGTIFTLSSVNFTASGAGTTAPFSYAVTAGALPAGLQLASSGALTGMPTETGVFPFYCTNFCSALHQEMQGYIEVVPRGQSLTMYRGNQGEMFWERRDPMVAMHDHQGH